MWSLPDGRGFEAGSASSLESVDDLVAVLKRLRGDFLESQEVSATTEEAVQAPAPGEYAHDVLLFLQVIPVCLYYGSICSQRRPGHFWVSFPSHKSPPSPSSHTSTRLSCVWAWSAWIFRAFRAGWGTGGGWGSL